MPKQKQTTTRKEDAKQKKIKYCDWKQSKTTSRKTPTKERLETTAKQNKNNKQEPEIEMKNRDWILNQKH